MMRFNTAEQQAWDELISQYKLSDEQAAQLKKYLFFLLEENKKINLTAITSIQDAISFHFDDSLKSSTFIDFNSITALCDIGTGGGFPGIPLKIMFPHMQVTLIEVVQKKVHFLREVIEKLSLENTEVCDLDWRTFLRTSMRKIDLFCARASLHPEKLIRVFSPSLPYTHAKLIYWASRTWEPTKKVAPYIVDEKEYTVGNKERRLISLCAK